MGGANTEVEDDTTDILIEAAIFDSVSIRYTAANLDLRSEASIRYGKGLSYEYTEMALKRACHLLEKYAGATILSGCVRHDVIDKTPNVVEFVPDDVNKLLGMNISVEDMKVELGRLGFDYELNGDKFIVTIPSRRLDIDPNVNDIAEEIVRLYGYQNLVSTVPTVPVRRGEYVGDVKHRKLVAILPNPMSMDKSVVRTTLIPSLLNVYQYNKKRKVKDISLYEIAKTYDSEYNETSLICGLCSGDYLNNGWTKPVKYDFYIVKGIVENVLDYMGFKNRYSFEVSDCSDLHPGISANILLDRKVIGVIGRVHPSILKDEVYVFEMSLNALMSNVKPIKYKEAPKYPGISKDMAFIVSKDVTAGEVMDTIKKAGSRMLDSVSVFDVYTGENVDADKKSIAFTLNFLNLERTLTEEEVMEVFNNIISKVVEKHNAVLRDK